MDKLSPALCVRVLRHRVVRIELLEPNDAATDATQASSNAQTKSIWHFSEVV